ncbi:MAG: GTP cyclohydrolase I FolE [Aeromonas veronii]
MTQNKQKCIQALIAQLLPMLEARPTDSEPLPPLRPGLQETPHRVAKAMAHWFGGYDVDVAGLFKVFEDGAENADQMVTVCNIPLYSHCEHHMAPIIGHVTVAYIPKGKIVGLSKLARVVDAFGRRLQVQERLTNQIAEAIQEHLDPVGVGVFVSARHLCMESRGVEHTCTNTVTTALRGAFLNDPATRAEFLQLARSNTEQRS